MGVASLVLGIISLVIGIFSGGILGWFGGIIGVVGIIMGVLGKKNPDTKSIATAGFICSIIGTVLSLLLYFACVACIGAASLMS